MKQKMGYLIIDNGEVRGSNGATVIESNTLTCNHCHRQMLRNPTRVRERGWCWNCDKYICDPCVAVKALGGCVPMEHVFEREIARVLHG